MTATDATTSIIESGLYIGDQCKRQKSQWASGRMLRTDNNMGTFFYVVLKLHRGFYPCVIYKKADVAQKIGRRIDKRSKGQASNEDTAFIVHGEMLSSINSDEIEDRKRKRNTKCRIWQEILSSSASNSSEIGKTDGNEIMVDDSSDGERRRVPCYLPLDADKSKVYVLLRIKPVQGSVGSSLNSRAANYFSVLLYDDSGALVDRVELPEFIFTSAGKDESKKSSSSTASKKRSRADDDDDDDDDPGPRGKKRKSSAVTSSTAASATAPSALPGRVVPASATAPSSAVTSSTAASATAPSALPGRVVPGRVVPASATAPSALPGRVVPGRVVTCDDVPSLNPLNPKLLNFWQY